MVAYFTDRANVDDLDVLNFSLHHLFCRVDYLYRAALPELLHNTTPPITEQTHTDDLAYRQSTWSKLRTIKHSINRLEPLCNLLSYWQQSYSQLAHFANHFAHVLPTIPSLTQLDEVFNTLLDSTCTIFGDILPGFQAISAGRVVDDAADATLLFDLMQQTDQLLL